MPIYVYKCPSGHEFELRQGFDAEPVAACPTCETPSRRKLHSPAVIYKGNGFYTTDYARKKVQPAGESHDGESTSSNGHDDHDHDHGHSHDHDHSNAQEGIVTPAS